MKTKHYNHHLVYFFFSQECHHLPYDSSQLPPKLYDEKEAEGESEEEKEKEEENTFYTGSMELSKEDLVSTASESDTDSSDELDEYDEDLKNSHSTFKIVFISFILLLLLAVLGYFVLKQMGIL